MSANEKKEKIGKSQSPASNSPSDGLGLTTARESRARKTEPSARGELADAKTSASPPTRKATGPRTTAGKRRSRLNALKSGIFANVLLLDGESLAEFESLLTGLRKDFQPQGVFESVLVGDLAAAIWRKQQCIKAGGVAVTKAAVFLAVDSIQTQELELYDSLREGETMGGMLRHSLNPLVLREGMNMLMNFRNFFEKDGFQKDVEPFCLRKLYGVDQNGAAAFRIYRTYQIYSKLATDAPKGKEIPVSPEDLKKEMLRILDQEIERLKDSELTQRELDEWKRAYRTISALIPSQDGLDRSVRYEAHLSREIEPIINLLERVQARRRGQPALPPVRVELSK
jgi:hypothetical protein